MANRVKNLTGLHIGRLTVLALIGKIKARSVWRCRCDCGEIAIVRSAYLTSGRTKSCGCLRRENGIGNLKRMREGMRRNE